MPATAFVGAGDVLDGAAPTKIHDRQGPVVAELGRWALEALLLVVAVAQFVGVRVWGLAHTPGLVVDAAAFGCGVVGAALLWSPGAGFLAAAAALLALNSRYGPQ